MPPLALIVGAAIFLVAVMTIAWIVQRAAGNGGWIDVFWTLGTGIAAVVLALSPAASGGGPLFRRIAMAALAAIWSLRLGLYIARRVARGPEDARYKELREEWGSSLHFRLFWFLELQAVVSVVLVLSIAVAAHNPAPTLRALDLLGVAVLAVAILGESLADWQLRRFVAGPGNRGRVCDAGLWAWSRHPNYFFEWLAWVAYPLIAMDTGGAYSVGWFAWLAPLVMYGVLAWGTGVPPLEAHMLRSRGDAFRAYQRRTSAFWLWPPGRRGA